MTPVAEWFTATPVISRLHWSRPEVDAITAGHDNTRIKTSGLETRGAIKKSYEVREQTWTTTQACVSYELLRRVLGPKSQRFQEATPPYKEERGSTKTRQSNIQITRHRQETR